MFTLILPKNRALYENKLDMMFALRERDAFDTDESIYIIYEDKIRRLFGSCRINPLRDSYFIREGFVEEENWDTVGLVEVGCVSFDEEAFLLGDPNKDVLTEWFYMGLLEVLKNFQVNNDLRGYVCLNAPEIHEACEDFGAWHFEAAFSLPHNKGDLHGGFLLCEKALACEPSNQRRYA